MPKLYDPVHQFIDLDDHEAALLDSPPFQRLRYIRQMGTAYLVFPGATHSRFEHSLGVMELSTQIFDRMAEKAPGEHDYPYWRKVLRMAALCHDVGHLPFSHVGEKALLGKGGHEKWTYAIIQSPYLKQIWKDLGGLEVVDHITKVAIGEKKLKEIGHAAKFTPWEKTICEIITGDFFGADRIDYLLRDSRSSGVSYGLFDYHQLIETIRVLPGLELGIEENGIESCEALLLARHFMHRRVYQYPTVKSYNFHLSRFMQKTFTVSDLAHYLSQTDNDVIIELFKAARDEKHPAHFDAKCILERQHRFRAIPVPAGISEADLEAFKKKYPDASISWDFVAHPHSKIGFTFPVLLRNQKIVPGSAVSTLSIPSGSSTWAYLAPAFEERFQQYIEK